MFFNNDLMIRKTLHFIYFDLQRKIGCHIKAFLNTLHVDTILAVLFHEYFKLLK